MPHPPRRPLLVALALLGALMLAACGDSHTKVTSGTYAGESGANAPYLDVGPLVYEVQQSRQLNPFDVEDAPYRGGSPLPRARLGPARSGSACSCRSTTTTPRRSPRRASSRSAIRRATPTPR